MRERSARGPSLSTRRGPPAHCAPSSVLIAARAFRSLRAVLVCSPCSARPLRAVLCLDCRARVPLVARRSCLLAALRQPTARRAVLIATHAFRSPRAVLVRSPRAARTTRSPPVLVPCPTAGSPVGLACYRYSHLHWLLSSSLGTNTTSTYIVK